MMHQSAQCCCPITESKPSDRHGWRRGDARQLRRATHGIKKKQRKHYTPEEKVAVLRRHLLDKEPISTLCDELGLQPTVFYRWQKEFFENGAAAFEQKARPNHSAEQERIAYLEKKIQTKDEVLAELMAEHVALTKETGEL
jgi:transposase